MVGTTIDSNVMGLKYACALLNSKLLTFYALSKEILRKGNKATPHVGVKGLCAIPIPNISKNQLFNLVKLVETVIEIKKRNDQSDVSNYLSQIDSIIYKLYGLTYDEILVVDPYTLIIRDEYEKGGDLC